MSSKSFFKALKETCRKIDSDVNDIKNKLSADHEVDEEVSAKRLCDIQDKIKTLKTDASNLKSMLEPKLAHTRNFIRNFKELIAETEESVSLKEDYLKQYGYKPVEMVPEAPVVSDCDIVTPVKKESEDDCPSTPILLDYGIASDCLSSTPQLNGKKSSIDDLVIPPSIPELAKTAKSNGNSGSTPTLDIVLTSNDKETPPLPASVQSSMSTFPSTPTLNL